ncbi:uridine kinase [Nonomuraea sp. NPDC050310]|uniref:uridine kinase n=1 Tax=unclassified Nonomuraea TaxID=2593643 RepID=UPI0033FE624F
MRARPISPEALVRELVGRIGAVGRPWVRVVVDGAPEAGTAELADRLVEPLRVEGRPAVRVSAGDFLRAASLRLEYGRTDPDEYYDAWLDERGLRREVLDPLGPGGSRRIVPKLWNAELDRAYRLPYQQLPEAGVLILDGPLLLGRGLPVEFAVHLAVSRAALVRKTPEELRWRLPAFERYEREVDPVKVAEVAVRYDDPRHPALVV